MLAKVAAPSTRKRLVAAVCLAALCALPCVAESADQNALPDAPSFVAMQGSAPASYGVALSHPAAKVTVIAGPNGTPLTQREIDVQCQTGQLHGKACRTHWLPMLWQSFEITALQNLGNIALDSETRHDLVTNPYWSTYVKCVKQFRYDQWRDDDSFGVDYVAHGLQGGIAAFIYEQNDPHGRGLVYVNNGNYWRSRLKGMAWIAVYEVQWKIGPASEASIGNSGLNIYYTPRVKGRSTNETGFQDFVDTPVVGFWWNVGEDAVDRFIMPRVWRHTHNKWVLTAASVMTPSKAVANALRYKPFYYRDFPIPPVHGTEAAR